MSCFLQSGLGHDEESYLLLKDIRSYLADAAAQVAVAHTWINQDNHGADLEKGKGQGDKIQGRPYHQHDPVTLLHAAFDQLMGKPIGTVIYFPECPGIHLPAAGAYKAGPVWIGFGCFRQDLGDIAIH